MDLSQKIILILISGVLHTYSSRQMGFDKISHTREWNEISRTQEWNKASRNGPEMCREYVIII
jgi:hypothetical protein